MITTNIRDRLRLVENTVASLKKHEGLFSQKIMSVDVFPDGVPLSWFDKFQKQGWKVLSKDVDAAKSMILNQRKAVSAAETDIILYTEDDILVNYLPKLTTIHKLFGGNIINGKPAGFICFNNHVWTKFKENPEHIISFINNLDNYITIDGDVFLVKNETIKDNYYLNFPVAITSKKLFLELQDYALESKKGSGVEAGMTKAWFDTGKDKEYAVIVSLKPKILTDIKSGKKITVIDFYNYANINFWNNDATLQHQPIGRRASTIF
ncbi:MAG TPA: hypothetical protein VJ227_03135 [Patescibacteria group bacterium]|nr:hypothetical protein [Patescibacteria group bacterium]